MEKLLILISNDDGVQSAGIKHLKDSMDDIGKAIVVAPKHEMSASSHSVTLKKPLYVEKIREDVFSVSGTPADCVILGLFHILNRRPQFVLSGINLGQNLGEDVFYSGTVAAAREGALYGIKSAAFSLVLEENVKEINFESAAKVAKEVVSKILPKLPEGVLLNVNIPNLSYNEIKGFKITRLSTRRYVDVIKRERDYIVIGGRPIWKMDDGTDILSVKNGYVSITPLLKDLTDYEGKEELERITREID